MMDYQFDLVGKIGSMALIRREDADIDYNIFSRLGSELKPGMNVSATIEGDRVPNALCIPVDAVNRGNTVTVPGPGAMNADNTAVADVSKLETREVTLGKSDGDFIEVTGGLEEGDTVLIPNQSSNMMAEMMGM